MRKQPDLPTFFVDVDLGKRYSKALSGDPRFHVEFQGDHFPEGANDDDWIAFCAKRGWVFLTRDGKIRLHHRPAVQNSSARGIIVVGTRSPEDNAANFLNTFPSIQRFLIKRPKGPYLAKLHYPGAAEFERLKPKGTISLWGEWPGVK